MEHCPTQGELERLFAAERDSDNSALLEAHVESCPDCQRHLEALFQALDPESLQQLRHRKRGEPQSGSKAFLCRLKATQPSLCSLGAVTNELTCEIPPVVSLPAVLSSAPNLPGYEILGEVGCGGMAVVYQARQVMLNRLVALKVMKSGPWTSAGERARFQREAEAIARLQHPNIVQVFEVGEHEGQFYVVVEFITGGSLSSKLAGTPQEPRAAAQLLETVARAIGYAHQQGIIHRDLKPANVLLTADGAPKVADFGLAKVLDEPAAGQTQSGQILGTPSYMAPEQAQGQCAQIGAATDIYALGAVLYELLTGRPPFRAATSFDTMMQVVHEEPVPPRRLQSKIPGELETICLRCLEKAPERRYATAAAMADDLQRFLRHEPIQARPAGAVERLCKWTRRKPVLAWLLGTVVVGLVALSVAVVLLVIAKAQESQARQEAEENAGHAHQARHALEVDNYFHRIALAKTAWEMGEIAKMSELLKGCPDRLRHWEWHYLDRLCHVELLTWQAHSSLVSGLALSPDGQVLATGGSESSVRLWEANTGRLLAVLPTAVQPINSIVFSDEGRTLAAGGQSKDNQDVYSLHIWDLATLTERRRLTWSASGMHHFVLSADSRHAVSSYGEELRLWDVSTGRMVKSWRGHTQTISALALSPDGRTLASGGYDQLVKVWELQTGQALHTYHGHSRAVACLAFSPDGRLLASGTRTHDNRLQDHAELVVWDTVTGKECYRWRDHTDSVSSLQFTPDKQRLVSASKDKTLRLWDPTTGKSLRIVRGSAPLTCLALRADGQRFATASTDGTVAVWDCDALQGPLTICLEEKQLPYGLAFSPDPAERRLAAAHYHHVVKVWDARRGQEVLQAAGHTSHVRCIAYNPDGRFLASGGYDKTVRLWCAATGRELFCGTGHAGVVDGIGFSPNGGLLASAGLDSSVRLWEVPTGRLVDTIPFDKEASCIAFHPKGELLAIGGAQPVPSLWHVPTRRFLQPWPTVDTTEGLRGVCALAFSADGRFLVSGGAGLQFDIHVWDVDTGKSLCVCRGHEKRIASLALSPDNKRLFSASDDGTIRVWELPTGREILTLRDHQRGTTAVALSSDGHLLATAGWDRYIRIWNGSPRP
jgi:eukaryotic-like serine/threonine-protein kinase